MTAELNEYALRFFLIVNVEHVLESERLKVKFVARVVIGRDRLRIRIDHDRFESELAQRKGGVHAAVIELNSLADTVRPAPQDHYLALAALAPLILVTVRGVIIRRVSFELCRARIDQAVSWENACRFSLLTDFVFDCSGCDGQLSIRKSEFLRAHKGFLF